MKIPQKYVYLWVGILVGLGAPVTHIFLDMAETHQDVWVCFLKELEDHGFLLSLVAPLVTGIFGFILGLLEDKVLFQKANLERMSRQLERQSMTDDITGLYNHRHILVEIDREVERANRYGRILSGMMIDIDDFKKANDHYGHLAGDALLRDVADVLQRSIRKVDILGRYGGDEFFVILPETDTEASRVVAERIQKNIRQHSFRFKETPLAVTVSIGLLSFPAGRKIDVETFIEEVDRVMLEAKRLGKDRVLIGN